MYQSKFKVIQISLIKEKNQYNKSVKKEKLVILNHNHERVVREKTFQGNTQNC